MTPGPVDPRVFNVNHIILCLDLHFVSVQYFFLNGRHWRRRKTRVRRVLRSLNNPEVLLLSLSSPLLEGFLLNTQHLPSQETEQQYHFVFSRSLSILHVPCTQPTWIIPLTRDVYGIDKIMIFMRVSWPEFSELRRAAALSRRGRSVPAEKKKKKKTSSISNREESTSVSVPSTNDLQLCESGRTYSGTCSPGVLFPHAQRAGEAAQDSRKARKLLLLLKKKGSLATRKFIACLLLERPEYSGHQEVAKDSLPQNEQQIKNLCPYW